MCEICKSKNQKLYTNTIHKKGVEPIVLKLCFQHDVELFKRGQEFFLLKYKCELAYALNGAMPLEDKDVDLSDLNFA